MRICLDDTQDFRTYIETDPCIGDVLYICKDDIRYTEVRVTHRIFRVNDGVLTRQIILYVKVLK